MPLVTHGCMRIYTGTGVLASRDLDPLPPSSSELSVRYPLLDHGSYLAPHGLQQAHVDQAELEAHRRTRFRRH